MPVTRSEEYYLPRGDLVIQVEDTLFRLHSGNLELHSGFFRDMFATASNEVQEGASDECPLRLPLELCSAGSFTIICKFICPKVVGVFPPVLVKDFAKWEPVLQASDALQMIGVQDYILARLQDNPSDIQTEPVRLLSWALRSELPLESLKLECFYALAYRRRPISEAEMSILGYKALAQVVHVRERIRLFILNPTSAESLRPHIPIHGNCNRGSTCQKIIFEQFICNLTKEDPSSNSEQNDFDIFRVLSDEVSNSYHGGCNAQSNLDNISPSLRNATLDEVVRRCVLGAVPPPVEP